MKMVNTFFSIGVFLSVVLQPTTALAGWQISGSPSEVHQRIVHPVPPPAREVIRPKKIVHHHSHHHRKRTYKDYLPKEYRVNHVERAPVYQTEYVSPSQAPIAADYRRAYVSVPAPSYRPRRPDFNGMYAITINGSLRENLSRIMARYNWRVAWKVPYDYNFDGRVTGNSLPNVIEKLIKPFPLRAVMYMSNRTLAVVAKERIS